MRRTLLLFLLLLSSTFTIDAQEVKTFDTFDDLDQYVFQRQGDTTYVVNFWATWCAPCVKELPYFEQLNEKYAGGAFKQILVSLDFKQQINSKLKPFIKKKGLQSEVVVLLDGKAQKWIDRVDPSWSGAIPITVMYRNGKRLFFEKEFHSMVELEEEMTKL